MKTEKYPDKQVFICDCFSTEHQVVFTYCYADDENDFDTLDVEVHLTSYRGFWARVKAAIKYIFGYKSKYGNWDIYEFDPKNADKLIEFLRQLKRNREAVRKKVVAANGTK